MCFLRFGTVFIYYVPAGTSVFCMFLMLALGSTNYLQKTSKIAQFSTKNAKKLPLIRANPRKSVVKYY